MQASNEPFDGQGYLFVLPSSSLSPHSYAVMPGLQSILAAGPSLQNFSVFWRKNVILDSSLFLGNPWCCGLDDGEDSTVTHTVSLDLLRP